MAPNSCLCVSVIEAKCSSDTACNKGGIKKIMNTTLNLTLCYQKGMQARQEMPFGWKSECLPPHLILRSHQVAPANSSSELEESIASPKSIIKEPQTFQMPKTWFISKTSFVLWKESQLIRYKTTLHP